MCVQFKIILLKKHCCTTVFILSNALNSIRKNYNIKQKRVDLLFRISQSYQLKYLKRYQACYSTQLQMLFTKHYIVNNNFTKYKLQTWADWVNVVTVIAHDQILCNTIFSKVNTKKSYKLWTNNVNYLWYIQTKTHKTHYFSPNDSKF